MEAMIDLPALLAKATHLECHAQQAPAVPGGEDGSGMICEDCARALAILLLEQCGDDVVKALEAKGHSEGYQAGFLRGWADCRRIFTEAQMQGWRTGA